MWIVNGRTRLNWPLEYVGRGSRVDRDDRSLGSSPNANAAAAAATFTLQPGDEIEVSVYGEMELQRKMLIRPDGKFSFPLAGEVVAMNRSVADVQTELTSKITTVDTRSRRDGVGDRPGRPPRVRDRASYRRPARFH